MNCCICGTVRNCGPYLDKIFSKYHALIWAKMEPILGDYYNEDSTGFTNFVFYLLSR